MTTPYSQARRMGAVLTTALLLTAALGCDPGGDASSTNNGANNGTNNGADNGANNGASGELCTDAAAGSGSTQAPVAEPGEFTTELLDCTMSAQEVAQCAGAQHSFTEEIIDGMRILTGNAIPNHDTALFPNVGNPNRISPQQESYALPLEPQLTDVATEVRLAGVATNGVKMEPQTAEVYSNTRWRYEALTFQGRTEGDTVNFPGNSLGFDCNFAHVQPNGHYHYHGVPTGLMPDAPALALVGWAADGFPILGRYGYSTPGDSSSELVELRGSYQLKEGPRQPLTPGDSVTPPGDYDGTFVQDWEYAPDSGDLDRCNGRQEEVEIQGTTYAYAYYLTYTYPFMPRCVWGTPAEGFTYPAANSGAPNNDMDPEGDGGAMGADQVCEDDADCDCPEMAAGCACAQVPEGLRCIPACRSDADCPDSDPMGNSLRCDPQQGVCRPAM